ncbi:MAG: hypothetical protein LBI42_06060 [Chitinispirillales bacterium]|jgi:hypothetical protein|nr:hypothetical protein [Chitinispirillales bacterium]
MNQIHEKDWAADDYWGGHSGMCSNLYIDKPQLEEKEDTKEVRQPDAKQ